MAMTGFDPTVVKASIDGVQKGYNALVLSLKTDMQSKFVDTMAKYWASKEAQEVFAGVKTVVNEELKNVREIYQNIVDSMNSAAVAWDQATHTQGWAKMGLGGTVETISVDSIQENINGVRGIDEAQAKQTTTTALNAIKTGVQGAINSTKTAISNSGFVGRNQAEKLIATLNNISSKINSEINKLISDVNKAITNTADTYGQLGAKVASAFDGKQ